MLGFRVWRGIKDEYGGYTDITLLEESPAQEGQLITVGTDLLSKPITAHGGRHGEALYSFVDKEVAQEVTYYYLIEEINNEGQRTFHWDKISSAVSTTRLFTSSGRLQISLL